MKRRLAALNHRVSEKERKNEIQSKLKETEEKLFESESKRQRLESEVERLSRALENKRILVEQFPGLIPTDKKDI